MPRSSSLVTSAELAVLDFLWEHGPAVVRQITQGIYSKNSPALHATVNSLLEQLEAKEFIERDRSGFAHVFQAKITRAMLVGKQLEQLADSHFGGSLTPMLLTLAEKVKLGRRDREALRRIIEKIH